MRRVKRDDGCTALSLASEKGHEEVVASLLKNEKVEVNLRNDDGRTSLISLASDSGHVQVVCKLIKVQYVDMNAKDNTGKCGWINLQFYPTFCYATLGSWGIAGHFERQLDD